MPGPGLDSGDLDSLPCPEPDVTQYQLHLCSWAQRCLWEVTPGSAEHTDSWWQPGQASTGLSCVTTPVITVITDFHHANRSKHGRSTYNTQVLKSLWNPESVIWSSEMNQSHEHRRGWESSQESELNSLGHSAPHRIGPALRGGLSLRVLPWADSDHLSQGILCREILPFSIN